MKPAIAFFYLLCAVLLFAGGKGWAHPPKGHLRQTTSVEKAFSLKAVAIPEFTSTDTDQTTVNADPDLGIDDEDDEQEHGGRHGFAAKSTPVILACSDLPPPANIVHKTRTADFRSSLCPCRYLVHRALRI